MKKYTVHQYLSFLLLVIDFLTKHLNMLFKRYPEYITIQGCRTFYVLKSKVVTNYVYLVITFLSN